MNTIEKLQTIINSNVHQILDLSAVQAAQEAIGEIERLRARVAELEARPKQCRWHATNEDTYPGVYTTECGHMFSFNEGDRAENDAVYCQYCGGEIVEDAE